jgi:hypothetical protein
MTVETSVMMVLVMMLLLGLGMGMVMQVLVIAVQNAVAYKDLGVATSGNTLFRSIGGSVGTAALGAVFASRLARELTERLPGGVGEGVAASGMSLETIAQLPTDIRIAYAASFTTAISTIFIVASVISAIGFAFAWLIPEHTLRETVAAAAGDVGEEMGGAMGMPDPIAAVPDAEDALIPDGVRVNAARPIGPAGLH